MWLMFIVLTSATLIIIYLSYRILSFFLCVCDNCDYFGESGLHIDVVQD